MSLTHQIISFLNPTILKGEMIILQRRNLSKQAKSSKFSNTTAIEGIKGVTSPSAPLAFASTESISLNFKFLETDDTIEEV